MGDSGKDGWLPGVSVFVKQGERICRVSDNRFGPGDDFYAIYLLPEGADSWQPQYKYD
jgi:hypothetical protein